MFREIRNREKITDTMVREDEHHEFEEIKPTTDMSIDEAKNYINELFAI